MKDRCIASTVDLPPSQTINPYWDIIRTFPGNAIDWKYDQVWTPDWTSTVLTDTPIDRTDLCGEYTWAIPDPESLTFVAEHLAPKAIEIGAGTGYWAWQLSQLGIDILAYDLHPPQHTGNNEYHSPRDTTRGKLIKKTRSTFYDVRGANHMIASSHSDRTLFLCWPPYDTDMAINCLNCYLGNRIVYIGEDEGGCNATDAFFEALERDWDEVASHRITHWYGLHDRIYVYERSH